MLTKYNLTSRQFIIGGIVLFVLMLIVNLSFSIDNVLRVVTIAVGLFGLALAGIFAVNSRSKNDVMPSEED